MRLSLMFAAGAMVFASTAQAQQDLKQVWGGGKPANSTYSGKYVPHIITLMEKKRMMGYQWAGESEGTVMNAMKVTEHPTHLAVGQLDILKRINGQPMPGGDTKYNFTVVAEDIGPECLYAVTAAKGYSTFGHILGNAWDLQLFTGGPKSGSFGTWQSLVEKYEDLGDVTVKHVKNTPEILKKTKDNAGSIGFFVMRPDPQSKTFELIQNLGLTLVPVVDFELQDDYKVMELKIATGGLWSGAKTHTTSCTSVALITGNPEALPADAPRKVKKRLAATIKRMGEYTPEELKPVIASWRDMWDNFKAASVDKVKGMMEASKKAIDDLAKSQAK